MGNKLLEEQVDAIRQTFGYLQKYKNSIFVIKTDGRLLSHPLFPLLIYDIVLLHNWGIKIVLIPGTRVRINNILQTFGIKTQEHDGMRISTEEAIPFIKMATFDVANQVMTMFAENNANSVIGNWIRARGIGVVDGIDFQSSGLVDKVDSASIMKILENNMIPIFPNIGWNLSGKPYNISSHELALKISVALKAEKLFFVTDFGGISADNLTIPHGVVINNSMISQLTIKQAKRILSDNPGYKNNEELELLGLSYEAAKSGVRRVHIVGGHNGGTLLKEIFSNIGQGTMIYADEYDNIRKLTHSDIPEILRIIRPLVEKGILIERTNEDIQSMIDDFVGYEVDGVLHACAALVHYDECVEICSVAVDGVYSGMGIGKKVVSYLISYAAALKKENCFLLTTRTSDWFEELGFVEGTLDNLPKEKRESYSEKRKSRIMILDLKNVNSTSKLR
ncbi:MAG: amino-acid N-acetyltransferase [Chitinispirillales bacterium]|jgi:amino-acid N-acetyltransferase|nr:amino-acid N-acetyltransferase [Chitinispirillales bacterium]